MDLRDQLKNLFPEHEEQDFEMPEFKSNASIIALFRLISFTTFLDAAKLISIICL